MARNRRESVSPGQGPYNQVGLGTPVVGQNLLCRQATTVAGNAASDLLSNRRVGAVRSAVSIHNCSASLDLWIRLVNDGDPAPTISLTDKDYTILPGASLVIEVGVDVDVYGQNSSGGATTSNYVAMEVAR